MQFNSIKRQLKKTVLQTATIFALCSASSLTLTASALSSEIELPHLGDKVLANVTPEDKAKYGELFLRFLHSQQNTDFDPIILNYLQHDLLPRLQDSNVDKIKPKLLLLNSTEINAFAAPDNIMGINLGLFIHANSESEFSSVIAHELGHMKFDHFALNMHRGKNQLRNNLLLLAASILVATQTNSSDAAAAFNVAGQTLNAERQAKYSRHLEMEADYYAISMLSNNNFDVHAMPKFFERLKQQYPIDETTVIPSFIKTHPLTQDRIAYTQARANSIHPSTESLINAERKSINENTPKKNKSIDELNYQLIRTRVLCKTAQSPNQAYQHYVKEFKDSNATLISSSSDKLINAYGALSCGKRTSQVLDSKIEQYLNIELLQRYNNIISLSLIENELHRLQNTASHNLKTSAKRINSPTTTKQQTPYEKLLIAQLLDQAGTTENALNILNTIKYDLGFYPQFWSTKSRNAHKRKDKVGLYLAEAEIAYLTNQLELAQEKLEEALILTNSFGTKAKIRYRLQEIDDLDK